MRLTRTATILVAALSVTGCFKGSSSKTTDAEKKGQLGVFYVVNVSRPVGGTITTPDGQLNCGTAGNGKDACGPATFSWNVKATLTAVPDAGQVFQSWAGDCGGTGACVLDTVSSGADKWVVAVFNPPNRLGHASIPDPAQHGPLFFDFVKKVPNTPKCNTCHGADYRGLANAPSCEACHASAGFPNWLENCGFCHGDPPDPPHVQLTTCSACHTGYGDNTGSGTQATNQALHMNGAIDISGAACTACHGTEGANAAPPLDTQGRSATTFVSVGAHQVHLATTIAKPVACGECHTVPSDVGHATNPPASKVTFGALANKGTTTVWDAGTATCASTYCHGGSAALGGGLATTPVWTTVDGTQKTCTSCHGAPPPAPHPQNSDCGSCHTGYSVISVDAATHVDGVVDVRALTCSTCHGDPGRTGADPYITAAPPLGTKGETAPAQPAVGAHLAHLSAGSLARAFACTDCHNPPTSMTHASGAVEFSFSVLAGGSSVSYDPATATCSNTYCHGNFAGGNTANRPVWTAGSAGAACGSCHGFPPAAPHTEGTDCGTCHPGYSGTSVNLASHVNGNVDVIALTCTSCHGAPPATPDHRTAGGVTACSRCHDQTVDASGNILTGGKHRNGAVDLSLAMDCAKCHGTVGRTPNPTAFGDEVEASPPRDLSGSTSPSTPGVGAHLVHVNGLRSKNLVCSDCHDVSSVMTGLYSHANGTVEMAWGTLATLGGVTPTYVLGSGSSCNSTYCHGNFRGGNGVGASPAWTTPGTLGCASCHGAPPPLSATTHHPGNTSCGSCHGTGYASTTVVQATHVDGTVTLSRSGCTLCHGDLTASDVAPTSPAAAPGFNSASADTMGNTLATAAAVGAHAAHVSGTRWRGTSVACGECHAVPGAGDVSHATGSGTGGARATLTFGALATAGGITTAGYAGSLTGAGGATAGTCSNTYCHGNFKNGSASSAPSWLGGTAAAACGSCHGLPPGGTHPASSACESCHTGYTIGTVNAVDHLNGTIDVSGMSCTSCHGDGTRASVVGADLNQAAAPPLDTQNPQQASGLRVGSHLAHVNPAVTGAVYKPIACIECHPDNSAGGAHPDSVVNLTFATATGANLGSYAPILVQGDGTTTQTTCATYCHGSSLNATTTRGSVASWTWNGAAADCGSCHRSPPGTANHHAAATLSTCAKCHSGTVDGAGTVNVAGGLHVNGAIDTSTFTCTSCHGNATLVASGLQDPNVAAAPTGAGAPDTYGNTAVTANGVGVHAAHVLGTRSRPAQCDACHAVPGTQVHKTGAATAGTVAFANLAIRGGIADATYAGAGGTCSNVYCHGNLGGGVGATNVTPSWKTEGTLVCNACHGMPPAATSTGRSHPNRTDCGTCHTGYTGTTVDAATHVDGTVQFVEQTCTSCHGDPARTGLDAAGVAFSAAPPADVEGLLTGGTKIGAHARHLLTGGAGGPTWSRQVACSECHSGAVPVDPLHANGQADVAFGTVATTGAVTPAYAGNTCSNTYCHGNFSNGAGVNAISWSSGTAACGSCHGNPPGGTHPAASATTCGNCHPNYDNASQSISNAATHVDGNLDVIGMSCTSCHGATGRASVAGADPNQASAPPVVASATGVAGAHLAHVNQGSTAPALSLPMACSNCHAVPSSNTHANAVVGVTYAGLSVAQGAVPSAYDLAGHTCSNTYCHGNFPGGNPGAPALSWSASGKLGCTACHGGPPALSAASHHPANTDCATCHGTGYTSSTVVQATHVDGRTTLARSGCTLCHGDLTQDAVAATSGAAAPGFNGSAADTTGATAATAAAVGAHAAHLTGMTWRATPIACSECHAVPGTGDVAHATGTGSGGARATVVFGTLATTGSITTAAYAGSTTAAGTNGAGTCSNVYCHGNFKNGSASNAPSWLGGTAAAACGSCHGLPPGGTHPASSSCETCHTGYTVSEINPANHLNGSVQVDALTCTSCHGQGTRVGVAGADVNQASAPPLDSLGAATGVRVGVHLAHVNPAPTGAVYRPVACVECHPDNAGNTSHSNVTRDVTLTLTPVLGGGANLGGFTATWTLGNGTDAPTTCTTYCHGATMGVGFTGSVGATWSWNSPTAATCGSCHGFPPTASHTGVLAAATDCNRCHGGTVNIDGSINVAGGLHINGQLDGGGEPVAGGTSCGGCHVATFDAMTGSLPKVSRHALGSDVPQDGDFAWTGATLGASVALADRSCITMCHGDHPHTLTSPAGTTHENNVYVDATTQAARAADSATRVGAGGTGTQNRARSDFDPTTNTGFCASCHQKPIVANGITVSAATFGASAHDFTSNTVGGTTYGWSYGLHDGSSFARNCTKCHASRAEGTTPASTTAISVHYSDTDANLLAGTTNPAGTAANFACYNCHGSTATPAAGAQGNRSGKDIQTQVLHATTTGQSGHPSNADTRHDSAAELADAAFGNALGVTAGAGQRHASCMDCHDPHEAKATSGSTRVTGSATNGNVAGPALQGAWGARLSSNPAFWTAPTSASFTKQTIAAGTDLQATLCFKCHTGYYWGTGTPPTSPSGAFAETDVAREFNPANVGNFATTGTASWESLETAGSFHPVLASAGSNLGATGNIKAPWTRTSLMTCTDCHASDTTTDPSGPHGSAAKFILKGPNTDWSPSLTSSMSGMPNGTFCINCHNQNFSSSRFPDHTHEKHPIACMNCHSAIPHGAPRPGLLNAAAGTSTSGTGAVVPPAIPGYDGVFPYYQGGSSNRLYLKTYPATNQANWSKSNCGCNGSGHG